MDYRTSKARRLAQNANCGAVIEPAVRLAIALRFLSGASIHDLTIIYNLGRSACYDCLWVVVDAVTKRMTLEFPLDDIEKLAILEAEFRASSRKQVWSGQVGKKMVIPATLYRAC